MHVIQSWLFEASGPTFFSVRAIPGYCTAAVGLQVAQASKSQVYKLSGTGTTIQVWPQVYIHDIHVHPVELKLKKKWCFYLHVLYTVHVLKKVTGTCKSYLYVLSQHTSTCMSCMYVHVYMYV